MIISYLRVIKRETIGKLPNQGRTLEFWLPLKLFFFSFQAADGGVGAEEDEVHI